MRTFWDNSGGKWTQLPVWAAHLGLRKGWGETQRTDSCSGEEESHTALAAATIKEPGLHEIKPEAYRDGPAVVGFCCALAVLAARARPGAIVWIAQHQGHQDFGLPYGPGLRSFGLDPPRVVLVRPRNDREALWALEEAARSQCVALALAQVAQAVGLVAARRVHLVAEKQGVPVFLLTPQRSEGAGPALTRWRVASGLSTAQSGARYWAQPRWRIALERRRHGTPLPMELMEWDYAAHTLRLGEVLAHRTLWPRTSEADGPLKRDPTATDSISLAG